MLVEELSEKNKSMKHFIVGALYHPLTCSNGKFSNSYFSITLTDHNYGSSSSSVFEMLYR